MLYVLVYFRFHTIKVYCKLCDLYRQSWFYITVVLQRLFDLTYSLYDIPACYIDSGVIFPITLITYQFDSQFDFINLYIWEQDFLKLESRSLGSTLGITSSGAIAGDGGVKISSLGKNDNDQIQLLMVDRSRTLVWLQIYSLGDSMFEESRGGFTIPRC